MHPNSETIIQTILQSRKNLPHGNIPIKKPAEEGGCGVTGFISSIPVSGRHIIEPSVQMHNRGNGKGGGIAAVGLSAADLGVSQEVLDTHYLMQVALLNADARPEVEAACITPFLDVHKAEKIPNIDDFREIEGLEVRPPDVWRYFVRVKPAVLDSKPFPDNVAIPILYRLFDRPVQPNRRQYRHSACGSTDYQPGSSCPW